MKNINKTNKKQLCILAVILGLLTPVSTYAEGKVGGEEALQRLMDGNVRFVKSQSTHPHQTIQRRIELTKGQEPFAIILSCSDSRVTPETVFDQGLGDIFVVRVAGNVVDNLGLGSIEYAAEHLHVPLIMVLGHEKCGAVAATVAGGHAPGHINSVVKAIKPAVAATKGMKGDAVENVVRANVQSVVQQIQKSKPILNELVSKGKLKVVGARYDLDTGTVEIIH